MTQRSIWLLAAVCAISLSSARADAPADIEVRPAAPKPVASKPATMPTSVKPKAAKNAPTSKPSTAKAATTKPANEVSADDMLNQMLEAPKHTGTKPLPPLPAPKVGGPDMSSGTGAVAGGAPIVGTLREGSYLVDRVGRLIRSKDGLRSELFFESDGTALQDPPLVIVPNMKLMQMEDYATDQGRREVRFRVSGTLTEYRGRNHILLDKVVIVPEALEKF